jgi:hypothetical protein
MFSFMAFAYSRSSLPDRANDEPRPMYSHSLVSEMQDKLAQLADRAVQEELEREHSNRNQTERPKRDVA